MRKVKSLREELIKEYIRHIFWAVENYGAVSFEEYIHTVEHFFLIKVELIGEGYSIEELDQIFHECIHSLEKVTEEEDDEK